MTESDRIEPYDGQPTTAHNLGLYRLQGFIGRRSQLIQLHEWMTGGDDLPAIAISGEQGNGKTTLATAAAWSLIHHFPDGVVRVGAVGEARFRLYDVVRTMDSVFGTTMTRLSEERWGLGILEQLYRRKRLLILDELSGATGNELEVLVDIIGHLNEAEGNSRVLLIDRDFSPAIAGLCQFQHIHLDGLTLEELPDFIRSRAPAPVVEMALAHVEELHALTLGRPMPIRLLMGLLLDFSWEDLAAFVDGARLSSGRIATHELAAFSVESFAALQPQAGPLLDRLVTAAGGATRRALGELFWSGLGPTTELERLIADIEAHALLDRDPYQQRVVMHPTVRRYMEQNVALLGEEWDRRHAHYYSRVLAQYEVLPLERWPEVDPEWGNLYKGADWCAAHLERLWEQPLMDLIADARLDKTGLQMPDDDEATREDLRLTRTYALALAHYAFWRHPPGILRWLAAGAVAALALTDTRNYAWFLMNIGRQLFFIGRVEDAVDWLKRAATIFDERDLLGELAYAFTDLGTSYRVLDRPRLALSYFRGAFDCVAQLGDQIGLATAYLNLGSASYGLNEFERALQQQRKALRIALRHNNKQQTAAIFNSMGLALEGMERLQEAQEAYTRSLELFRAFRDPQGISACYNNLGSVSYALGNFDQAVTWYELDLELAEQRGAWTDMAATLHNLGHVALEQQDYARALDYFQRSRELYAAFNLVDYMAEESEMIEVVRQAAPDLPVPA